MTASIRFAAVAIDCADPPALGAFYEQLLGWRRVYATDEFVALTDGSTALTLHRVPDHVPPGWPVGSTPKQLHLDLAVDDLDAAVERAVAAGATLADEQPRPEAWRVLVDPAGHPFCLSAQIPDFGDMPAVAS